MKNCLKALSFILLSLAIVSCSANPPATATLIIAPVIQTTPIESPLVTDAAALTPSPTPEPTPSPTPEPKPAIRQIATGYKACYILRSDGTLWAWGDNQYGQIGDGTHDACNRFKKILDGVKRLTSNNMAIKDDDTLWAWGGDEHLSPYRLDTDVADANTTCILKKDGSLWAYGSRFFALGDGKPAEQDSKVAIPLKKAVKIMDHVRSIPVAGPTSMAIKDDGSLWLWGDPGDLLENAPREMVKAMKSSMQVLTPVKIMDEVKDAATMSFLEPALLVLRKDGTLFQWGAFLNVTKLYEKAPIPRFPKIRSFIEDKATAISACGTSAFAVLEDGRLVTWGLKYKDEPKGVEDWPTAQYAVVEIAQDVRSVSAGNDTLLVLKKDGSLLAAGKACYDPTQPDTVSDSVTLVPAFQEMWGQPMQQ